MNNKMRNIMISACAAMLIISGGIALGGNGTKTFALEAESYAEDGSSTASEAMEADGTCSKADHHAPGQRRHHGKPDAHGAEGSGDGAAARGGGNSQAGGSADSSVTTNSEGITVTIAGGHDTDPVDHGRPVVLIAAALGVPTDVFRDAFSGVTPAGLSSGGPTEEEAQKNKAALMSVLSTYGITNERLDEVSNFYRYNGRKSHVWQITPATATAVMKDGVVTGIAITNPGAGYSSAPVITITGPDVSLTATAEVVYTTDFGTNGSIKSITLN